MVATNNNGMEIVMMNAVENNLVNKSQVKGESYSIFCLVDHNGKKEYKVIHNTSKKLTLDHEQIFVCAKNDEKLYVSFRSKNIETDKELKVFTKEELEEIAKEANQIQDGQSIFFDDKNDKFYIDKTKEDAEEMTDAEVESDTIVVNSPKQVFSYYGIDLTAKEAETIDTIFKIIQGTNEDITKPIYSKWVTGGSLSISGVISMLNRKGIVNCDKGRINGGRKLPIISLTETAVEMYNAWTVRPINIIKTYTEDRPEYKKGSDIDWEEQQKKVMDQYCNTMEEMKMLAE